MSLLNNRKNIANFLEGGYIYQKAKHVSQEECNLLEEAIKDLSLIIDRFPDKVLRKNGFPTVNVQRAIEILKQSRDALYQRLKKRAQYTSSNTEENIDWIELLN